MALVPLSGLLWHQAHIEGTYIRAGKMLIHKTKANKSFFKSVQQLSEESYVLVCFSDKKTESRWIFKAKGLTCGQAGSWALVTVSARLRLEARASHKLARLCR